MCFGGEEFLSARRFFRAERAARRHFLFLRCAFLLFFRLSSCKNARNVYNEGDVSCCTDTSAIRNPDIRYINILRKESLYMKLRPPAIPLITVDPYFSVWSPTEKLYDSETMHWTGKPNALRGTVTVDGEVFRFMGLGEEPTLTQTDFTYNALSTYYTFRGKKIELKLCFTTPLLPDDLSLLSRPVSYLRLSSSSLDVK